MSTKKSTLDFHFPEFHETLKFVSDSLVGDFGVQELEKQVKALSETAPFLMKIMAAIGDAQERMDAIKDIPGSAENPELARRYLEHNDTFCSLQGALGTLMIVARILQKQSAPKPRTRKKKT
jgi:hypothetical protein